MKRPAGFRLRAIYGMICAGALCVAGSEVCANDSTAELATGGLIFVRNDDVEMRAEDLFISTTEIRDWSALTRASSTHAMLPCASPASPKTSAAAAQ